MKLRTTRTVVAGLTALIASSALAQAPAPAEAAGKALMQCVAHTTGGGTIVQANETALAANGLVFATEPPAFLANTKVTPYGTASYAASPSSEGQIWAIGYAGPGSACLVFALGSAVSPIEARLDEMFAIPGAWKVEKPAKSDDGERKKQFGWQLDANRKLTALVSIRDLASTAARGFVMVTISQTKD